MAAYNAEYYIKDCINSILDQVYSDFEFIIIDDNSSDNTRLIIEGYASTDDRIISIYNTDNLGLTKNLNKAIKIAKGEYIARMDADDISLPERFIKQVEFLMNNTNIDLVGTSSVDLNEKGEVIGRRNVPETHEEIVSLLPIANPISHPTVMFRKERFSIINFYNEEYRTTQDYEMWFRAVGSGLKFYNLQEVLFQYRMNDDYVKRKSFKYRFYDFKLRVNSFKYIKLPFYKYYYTLIPLLLGVLPESIYYKLKKIDPRSKA